MGAYNPEGAVRMYWLIGGAVAIVFVSGVLLMHPHWWTRVTEAKVSYGEVDSPQSTVYQSLKGDLLVSVNHTGKRALYVIKTSPMGMGMPNRSAFYILPGFAYSKDVPPLCAPMVKAGVVDPQLVVEQRKVEFTSFEKARIRVTW
jgi:hypothetical protein